MSINRLVVLILVCVLAGCSTITGYPNSKTSELPSREDSIFLLSDKEYSDMTSMEKRNEVIHRKIRDIDLAYSVFEASMYKENVVTDLTTDVTLLALAGGTVLTGSSSEKELLAAISAFILGSKSAFDKRALFENTMSVLVQKMRADRAVIGNDILRGKAEELKKYTPDSAAIDIARYYYAGTIPSALTGLAKVAVDEETEAKEEQKEIINDQFTSDAARTCLINYWKPDGTNIDATNQNAIVAWKNASDYKDMFFGLFMNGATGAEARVEAVSHLIETGKIAECSM